MCDDLGLKDIWNQFRDKYMTSPVDNMENISFSVDEIKRYQIIFSGLVQGVGFRYETWGLAKKLGLTGFVKNVADGTVYAEIQGQKNKIAYLVECLKLIPRIHIEQVESKEMELKQETDFEIAN